MKLILIVLSVIVFAACGQAAAEEENSGSGAEAQEVSAKVSEETLKPVFDEDSKALIYVHEDWSVAETDLGTKITPLEESSGIEIYFRRALSPFGPGCNRTLEDSTFNEWWQCRLDQAISEQNSGIISDLEFSTISGAEGESVTILSIKRSGEYRTYAYAAVGYELNYNYERVPVVVELDLSGAEKLTRDFYPEFVEVAKTLQSSDSDS